MQSYEQTKNIKDRGFHFGSYDYTDFIHNFWMCPLKCTSQKRPSYVQLYVYMPWKVCMLSQSNVILGCFSNKVVWFSRQLCMVGARGGSSHPLPFSTASFRCVDRQQFWEAHWVEGIKEPPSWHSLDSTNTNSIYVEARGVINSLFSIG